ncbi:MAG: DUF3038 domain-containing protein [Cyanobacteria bacterium]|uniref:DUF3038 domain-containing protein n=1 Tax=Geminocystis sp. TaxID=2664100 RepID=UPI001D38E971|nr:DUF3038 domain-containing protein [Cyanobacteria bacterium CG_2015-16_32_12]NCO77770.1 DUF3038 domain-containing protein [Cyanobacteria bacterium CG_2015-22_32_23]NCQ04218.1 DUF3038 domain-containing protein [Cyanobacteria bacterium CG_2015-09_32_10]NCQ42181.1 DUF3038 domain-containing protein [Cyanobacteria bacterium CG_2015-04_32_10]NCS83393.1 DUF3038 domain-containing protein [Cyanobacteria bacterium CG_2015-02_32_10]
MLEEQENLIDVEKVNNTPHRIKLIYLGILALGIKLESTVIPISKSELDILIEYLAELLQKNDELIRRACSLLEQIDSSENTNYYYGIVKDYLDKFLLLSQSHESLSIEINSEIQNSLALKTLTDLLFYSSKSGKYFLKHQLQCL